MRGPIRSLLLCLLAFSTRAADDTAAWWRFYDDGRVKDFESVAATESPFPGQTNPSAAQESRASDGLTQRQGNAIANDPVEGLVLYERGLPRSAFQRRRLTSKVLAEVRAGTDPGVLAHAVAADGWKVFDFAPSLVLLQASSVAGSLELTARLRARPEVTAADPLFSRLRRLRTLPGDPLLPLQWGLANSGQAGATAGVDIGVTNVWPSYTGRGVRIAVVDDGVLYTHPDLAANYDRDLDYDYRSGDDDPIPEGTEGMGMDGMPNADSHGTAAAGLIAAQANNDLGGVGAAYGATLVGVRLLGGESTDEQEAAALLHSNAVIQVSNNSWGGEDDGQTKGGAGKLVQAAVAHGAEVGRGGRGLVYVWAAGNGAMLGDNANYDTYVNSIHGIAVGAVNDRGQRATYSEPGACLLLVAPAGGDSWRPRCSPTTDLVGAFGYNAPGSVLDLADADYTSRYGGTSAAAPLVSGVAALMLEANPELGWRDVQEVLLRSAVRLNPADPGWITNQAGLRFHHDFGAGLVNAEAAVSLAKTWTNLGPQVTLRLADGALEESIPDHDPVGMVRIFEAPATRFRVEHVRVTVSIAHPARGELAITLISPHGTESRLAEPHGDRQPDYDSFAFMSVFHWGETVGGRWRLKVADVSPGNQGTFRSAQIELLGTQEPAPVERPGLRAVGFNSQGFALAASGVAGRAYAFESSADLVHWTTVYATNAPGRLFQLLDASAFTATRRFYRLTQLAP